MVSVPGALLGTALAGADASIEQVVDDELVRLRRTRKNSRRDVAYVRAGDTQGRAHPHFGDVVLGEVGVGAGGTGLNTPQAGIDGRRDRRCAKRDAGRHGIQDLFGVGHIDPPDGVERWSAAGPFGPGEGEHNCRQPAPWPG